MLLEDFNHIIRSRRSHYAFDFSEKKIDKNTIETIVTNGLWAPTHKLTQPWRFVILEGEHPNNIGGYMADYYREIYTEDEFSTERFEQTKTYASNATLLALIFQPSKKVQLPEWEEIAAISCAVQNMWLTCTAMNIGSYWDTGAATLKYVQEYVTMEEDEKCVGIFYMGHLKDDLPNINRRRKPISKKLSWQS